MDIKIKTREKYDSRIFWIIRIAKKNLGETETVIMREKEKISGDIPFHPCMINLVNVMIIRIAY